MTSIPASVHRATVPAAPKSTSSGCAVMERIRAISASSSTPAILAGLIERPALARTRLFRAGWLSGAGCGAVASDGGCAVGAGDLAGAVGVDGQGPAEFVQDDVVVPPAVAFEVVQAGVAAVCAVDHVVGFAAGGGLVAAAGVLAVLVPQGDQAAQVGRDLVGLADIEGEGGPGEGLAEQVAAQHRRGAAGPGDDLQDLGQDLVLQLGQGVRGRGGLLGMAGRGTGQAG